MLHWSTEVVLLHPEKIPHNSRPLKKNKTWGLVILSSLSYS